MASEGVGMFANERSLSVLMGRFRVGVLVVIKNGVHHDEMPDHRVGLIVRECDTSKGYTSFYEVAFIGTDFTMKFHEMFLELKNESR